jgi:hypothetical protein
MKQFKRFFAFLFILSLFVGVVHELNPHHLHDGTCEVCLIAHSPTLLSDPLTLTFVSSFYEPFDGALVNQSHQEAISLRNRSPPMA